MKLQKDQEAQTVAIKRMSPQALQGLQNFQREVRERDGDGRREGGGFLHARVIGLKSLHTVSLFSYCFLCVRSRFLQKRKITTEVRTELKLMCCSPMSQCMVGLELARMVG